MNMKYTLMHKNICVIDIEIDPINGRINQLGDVYEKAHLPVGVFLGDYKDIYRFEDWWRSRSIPMSRNGIEKALREMNIRSTDLLILKSYGLSLSDQYWIKPSDQTILWDKVNFFDNDFSEDVGNILLGEKRSKNIPDLFSPEYASNGWLQKKWKIINNKRYLVKGGSGYQQEPYNEVIAAYIAKKLGITHTEYKLESTSKQLPVCVCENFVTRDTELISAGYINLVLPFEEEESKYEHFIRCCEYLHIPDCVRKLDEMMVLDYIIANQDRHMGNFGVIRNADTLEYIGFSPIYDSGTSIRYDTPVDEIDCDLDIEAQPFANFHSEQIKLVTDINRFPVEDLSDIDSAVSDIFKKNNHISDERAEKIIQVLKRRINLLVKYIEG